VENATGDGRAYPASIGTAMVDGEKLAAESSFAQLTAAEMERSRLMNVSYFILSSVLPPSWVNSIGYESRRVPFEHQRLQAEGVYDTQDRLPVHGRLPGAQRVDGLPGADHRPVHLVRRREDGVLGRQGEDQRPRFIHI
jgi:hypothetical protein